MSLTLPRLTMLLVMALLAVAGCSGDAPPADGQPDRPADGTAESTADVEKEPATVTGREVFKRMAAAYKAAESYADAGALHLIVDQGGRQHEENNPFQVALRRPNQHRLEAYEAKVVVDDEHLYAAMSSVPGQVMVRDAPARLTLDWIDRNEALVPALGQAFASTSVRMVLLLADDPLSILLDGADEPELGEPGEVEGRACYRVALRRENQKAIYWIDQETYVLRRIDLPTVGLIEQLSAQGPVNSASLVARFSGAELDPDLPPEAFQFEVPADARRVKFFEMPHPAQLLGEPAPPFEFTTLAGEPLTNQSVAGKVVVLDFWATYCGPCRISLPNLEEVRRRYADNPQVAFWAVSVDSSDVDNGRLRAMFDELGVEVPIARDLPARGKPADSSSKFHVRGIPTMFLLGPDGMVQHYEVGVNSNLEQQLPELIDRLLAGQSIFDEAKREYEEQLRLYEERLDRAQRGEPATPPTEIAEPSDPQALKLEPAWTIDQLAEPGNLLAWTDEERPRLAVIDAWKRIVELGTDGTVLATHEVEVEEQEAFNTLRTAVDGQGNRYFAALGLLMGQQRMHLLDAGFNKLTSFPEGALDSPHAGIGDVQLGSLQPDEPLRALVGYWGDVGVQAVSLQGDRVWSNRNVPGVQRMALTAPDADGRRQLLCAGAGGALAVIDDEGRLQAPLSLPGRFIAWIVSAELGADGDWRYCGLAGGEVGRNEAIGIALEDGQARETWSYRLPDGLHTHPVEPVVSGQIEPDGPGAWLLPGPDGSVHILAADGTVVDRFNHGVALSGIATITDGGQTLLLLASEGKIEALRVTRNE